MESKNRSTPPPPPSLPNEIIFYEIFPRLPATSIHRFRCLSTSFRRLPSDKQFLSVIRRLSPGPRYFTSFPDVHLPQALALYSVDRSGAASSITISGETPQNPRVHANIVNGLIFTVQRPYIPIDDHVSNVQGPYIATVFNAETNETIQLPPVPVLDEENYRLSFYPCHDPETDTYKVLHIAAPYMRNDNHLVRMMCSVFTLNSSWRGYNLQKFKQMGNSKSVCINGTLYLTKFCLDNIAMICAFVVESENFYSVSYPAGLSQSRYNQCHLIELKGALAVIDVGSMKCEIMVWIKEKGRFEFGRHESWTELRIDFDPRWEMDFKLLKSCGFSKNCDGEIVMMGVTGMRTKDGCWIFIYNVDKGEWRRVKMLGVGDHYMDGHPRFEEYVKNISSLTQMLNPSSRLQHKG